MLEFLVHDAERSFGEGNKVSKLSFWSYKIMTRSYLPSYQNPPVFPKRTPGPPTNFISHDQYVDYCAWHRFSDFEWLLERLQQDFPGHIFPPMPEKDSEGTTDKLKDLLKSNNDGEMASKNPLISARIRRFQLFLNALGELKFIHESTHLRAFVCMEEPEWVAYKEEVNKANKPKAVDRAKSFGMSLLHKVKDKKNNTPQVVFGEAHPMHKVRESQKKFADSLLVSMKQMRNMIKWAQPPNKQKEIDELCKDNANKSLSPAIVYNGHFVRDADHPMGTVRHMDRNDVWVKWDDAPEGAPLSQVPIHGLQYPSNGVVDSAMFCVQELISQIDSFLLYIQFRNDTAEMEKLVDHLWFWHQYAQMVVNTVDALEEIEKKRSHVSADAATEKKDDKRKLLEQEASELKQKFDKGVRAFEDQYAFTYRPGQTKALKESAMMFGTVSTTLFNDDDWDRRMQRAEASLPLMFELPEELESVQAQRDAEAQVQPAPVEAPIGKQQPETWSAPPAAPTPQYRDPQQDVPPPQPAPQQQASSWGNPAGNATPPPPRPNEDVPAPSAASPQSEPEQEARARAPSQAQKDFGLAAEDDTPPPPPPPAAEPEAPPAADEENTMLPPSSSPAAPASEEHYDGDEPPPLPPQQV